MTIRIYLVLLTVAMLALGCGGVDDDDGLTPATSYREGQIDRALAGVTVIDGFVVPDPAPALPAATVDALLAEVEALLEGGRRVEAIERAVAAVRGAPEHARAFITLGRALLTTKRLPTASAAFASAVVRDPASTEALFLHGVALDGLNRRPEAVARWREVLDLDPTHGAAHARLAAVGWLRGDPETAADHLASAMAAGAAVPQQLAAMILDGRAPSAIVVDGHDAGAADGEGSSTVVGPQIRINPTIGSVRGNETTAAAAGSEVVAGWNDYSPGGTVQAGISVSLDGETFADQVVRAPAAHQSSIEGDPMTAVDPRTGTLWVGAISFNSDGGVFVARKQPGSTVFEPSVLTYQHPTADKGWMAAGQPPGQPDVTRLYLTYNLGLQRSDDLGDSWSPPAGLGSGIGFLPRVGADGPLYISYWNYGDGHFLRRSFDGGQSFLPAVRITTLLDTWDIYDQHQIPGLFRAPPLPVIAVDPTDGTLYCVYPDTSAVVGVNSDVDLWLTTSTDSGASWSSPMVISADQDPPGDQFFPWLEVDQRGRLHLLYYDTGLTIQDDTAPNAWIDAFYAVSEDRGATWTRHRLTASSFDSALTDLGNGQFIGDYLGMGVDGDRAWPVYLSTEFVVGGLYTHEITLAAPIFADDFESGDTGAWSAVNP
jgi:Flp pilus assembly protein TadD